VAFLKWQRNHSFFKVVEAFFLNEEGRYLEVEFSPRGRYIVLMLTGERKDALHTLPLQPNGAEVHNPCFGENNEVQAGCESTW